MLLPAPCARITAGVRPGRRKPGGSATTADTAPPPGNAIRRRRLASFIGGSVARAPIACGRGEPRLAVRVGIATAAMVAPIIGLTGGIGAGKSMAAAFLTELGARVIDADRIGHEVYRPGSEGFARVMAARGLTREEVERRLDAQTSDAERRRHADLVIENDGSPAALRAAVEAAWRTLGW